MPRTYKVGPISRRMPTRKSAKGTTLGVVSKQKALRRRRTPRVSSMELFLPKIVPRVILTCGSHTKYASKIKRQGLCLGSDSAKKNSL